MTSARQFPPLKESDVRRLASAASFKKGMRLWDDESVREPLVAQHEPLLFAQVREGTHRLCQVMAQHLAGDELTTKCDCEQDGLCSHAVALLLAWVNQPYAFTAVEAINAEVAPAGPPQQWQQYLSASNMQQLRAIARRHGLKPHGNDRAGLLAQLSVHLSAPETLQHALQTTAEAQQRVLQMLYLLSDGQPDTLVDELQHALGWHGAGEVEEALRELSERGLAVAVRSPWHRSPPYTLAPQVAPLVPSMSDALEAMRDQPFEQPRNVFVEPYAGDLTALTIERPLDSLLELLLLARHLPLHARPASPELAQARSIKALRHWTYLPDEVVRLQVKPGWLHQSDSVLSVPPPEPRLDDASVERLCALTADDALGEFVNYLLASPLRSTAGAIVPTQPDLYAQWQQLGAWTELWLAQRTGALTVRRAVQQAHLTYFDWLQQLARARRFVTRVLALVPPDRWHDFESLLKFIHLIHADFLRDRPLFANLAPSWWLEVRGKKVDPHKYESWRESYGLFVEMLLRGPLRWLGAVELAVARAPDEADAAQPTSDDMPPPQGALKAVRLTAVGAALLRSQPLPQGETADAPLEVSDDLRARLPIGRRDIGAYLTLERLAQFERACYGYADYRFTMTQARAAFEQSLTADDALAQLEHLTRAPLPDAVRAQWQHWWAHYAHVRWYDGLTLLEFADDYILQELLTQSDLGEHLIFTFGARLVAVRPESADAIARQLVKKGYTPKIE